MAIQWSPQQSEALNRVEDWFFNSDEQVFRLFGYAGTGKTTLAKHLAAEAGQTLFAAYTGKAAYVMQQNGCVGATTIHSLAYIPRPKGMARLYELQAKLAEIQDFPESERDPAWESRLSEEIKYEKEEVKKPSFVLDTESVIRDVDLLVLDEVSMVGQDMGHDLESFGTKILALGDPAQLPPVNSKGYFTQAQPDVLLTEIHRQALDNPILKLATSVRQGEKLSVCDLGRAKVLSAKENKPDWTQDAQFLVGTNKVRRKANARVRHARGLNSELPELGDRLVCLRNNHREGLLNGAIWNVVSRGDDHGDTIDLCVASDDDGRQLALRVWKAPFQGEDVPFGIERLTAEEFDYGYALTVHKSQGSQWPNVVIIDESHRMSRQQRQSWLYTALTRASERVTVYR